MTPVKHTSMETRSLEPKASFARAQLPEIFGSLRDNIRTQFHDDTAYWFAAYGHIEEDAGLGPIMTISF